MTAQYKKFMKLLEKWPLDLSKGDRDLGLHIRNRVKQAFEGNQKDNLNTETCNRQYEALNRIADDFYLKKHKRTSESTATGLTSEECNTILSTDTLEYLEEENKGFISKLFDKKK